MLQMKGIKHNVLNAKLHKKEAEIVALTVGSMVLSNFILQPHVATSTSLEEMLGHYGKLLRKK